MKLMWESFKSRWEMWFAIIGILVSTIYGANLWIANVDAYDGRITENQAAITKQTELNEEKFSTLGKKLDNIDWNLAAFMNAKGVKPLKPVSAP